MLHGKPPKHTAIAVLETMFMEYQLGFSPKRGRDHAYWESQIEMVSMIRKLNVYQIIPDLNVKWHLRSIFKERCTRLWFESLCEEI